MLCTEIVSDIQNNFCTQHVLPMFYRKKSFCQRFTCNLMITYKSCCLIKVGTILIFMPILLIFLLSNHLSNFYATRKVFCAALKNENIFSLVSLILYKDMYSMIIPISKYKCIFLKIETICNRIFQDWNLKCGNKGAFTVVNQFPNLIRNFIDHLKF